MTHIVKSTLIAALLAASAATGALASSDEGEVPEAARATLTERLTAEGYELRKFEMDDGLIEVYAIRDGETHELYFDAALNPAKETESDDD